MARAGSSCYSAVAHDAVIPTHCEFNKTALDAGIPTSYNNETRSRSMR